MRLIATVIVFLVPVVLAPPVLAQETTTDTTSVWRYFPLAVGDVWEYERWEGRLDEPSFEGYTRRSVVGDTTLFTEDEGEGAHRRYFELLSKAFGPDGTATGEALYLVRFDTTRAMIRWAIGDEDVPWDGFGASICPLDADFTGQDHRITCEDEVWGPVEAEVTGGYEEDVQLPPGLTTSVKRFFYFAGVDHDLRFAADVGLLYAGFSEIGSWWYPLVYARVGGVEYGTRIPVGVEAAPGPSAALGLSVHPNPLRSAATVEITTGGVSRVRLAVYDVLGREVAVLHEGPLLAGDHRFPFDAAALPAGSYYARVAGGGAHTTASVTVVH
jgi:hypothetical protein